MIKNRAFNKGFIISLLLFFLLSIIIFEAFQQLYYIKRFALPNANQITLIDLLSGQLYRWGIWLLFSPILWYFSIQKGVKRKLNATDLLQYGGLVLLSIIIISGINVLIQGDSFIAFVTEHFPFFIFQKGLVFTLGYTAITVTFYLYFINKKLQIKVQSLSEIKKNNQAAYDRFKHEMKDSASFLNIKIGHKHKIIPIENIRWIASDDYCVKIHSHHNISYSMRSSLKTLEVKLKDNNFLRVHRTALVNMNLVKEVDFSKSPKLILKDGTEIAISKSKLKMVRAFFTAK